MTTTFRDGRPPRPLNRRLQAATLLLLVWVSLGLPRVAPAQAEAALPPVLVGKLEWSFNGRAEGENFHDRKQYQSIVHVRLRWNEDDQIYEDFGSSFNYSGTYDTFMYDPANKVSIAAKGSEQGGGLIADSERGYIGAHIQSDEGQPREIGLSIGGLPTTITGSVTYQPLGVTEERSDESSVTLLCDDRNWLVGKEPPDQPGLFSMACTLSQSGGSATQQTTVSGFLTAPGLKPRINAIRFEQQNVETGAWEAFTGAEGTVDGNQVRVIATVENPSGVPYTLPVRFLDGETHAPLPEGTVDVALNPGQSAEVTYEWDTEGWAWDTGAGAPEAHPNRAAEVRLGSEAVLYDVWNEPIQVRAKPVFFVHGLNSNAATWAPYTSLLLEANYTWRAFAVPGLRTGNDLIAQEESATLIQNASTLHQYIEQIRREQHAWHVDIVAHSMGGLISRQYIHSFMAEDTSEEARVQRPVVKHLVMLGTPNQGSECATWSLVMNTGTGAPNRNAPLQLMPEYVAYFNTEVTRQKDVQFSVLAGTGTPYVCWPPEGTTSDGVVLVPSAHHIYSDVGLTASNHIEMTGSRADFLAWVKPHLVSSNGAAAQGATPTASGATTTALSRPQITQVLGVTLAPGETHDLSLFVPAGKDLGVMLRTAPAVTATLRDPSGTVVQTSDRAPAGQEFRTLVVPTPTAGTWTLRLTSDETRETVAAVVVGMGQSALRASAEVIGSGGERTARLTLTRNGAPVAGATATAQVLRSDGTLTTIPLVDDGLHADGGAGDGVYGTPAGALRTSAALIAHATAAGEERTVVAVIGASDVTRIFLPQVHR